MRGEGEKGAARANADATLDAPGWQQDLRAENTLVRRKKKTFALVVGSDERLGLRSQHVHATKDGAQP